MLYDPLLPEKCHFTKNEKLAYEACFIWDKLCKIYFPKSKSLFPRKTKDIRSCMLFKCCHSFIRERADKLQPYEIPMFLRAQLEIKSKFCSKDSQFIPLPTIMLGENASKRYFAWKKIFDSTLIKNPKTGYKINMNIVQGEFNKTKILFEANQDIFKSIEGYKENIKKIIDWVVLKKISPLYVVVSPWINLLPDDNKEEIYKISLYESNKEYVNDEVKRLHKSFFPNEYN